jgi:hypothetical protein
MFVKTGIPGNKNCQENPGHVYFNPISPAHGRFFRFDTLPVSSGQALTMSGAGDVPGYFTNDIALK